VPITVVCGRQRVTVIELSEGAADDGVEAEVCTIGRGSPQFPVDIRLADSAGLSRRAALVRCVDGSWWQIRQVGQNGLSLKTERGAILPVSVDWTDVPARFGVSYVTVTTPSEVFEFKVEPNASGTLSPDGPGNSGPAPSSRTGANVQTRLIPKVGYWRVGAALCEPALRDGSEHLPTNPEIVNRLDRLGLEAEGFTTKAVEKRFKYLYEITGVQPGDRSGLRRRLIDARVVTLDDVKTLFAIP
jgi:hypothetical protein